MQADDLGGRRGGLFNADQLALSEQMIGYWSRFAGRLTDPGPAGGNGAAGRPGSAERPFEHFAL